MIDYSYDLRIAESQVKTAEERASNGDSAGASSSYKRAARVYEQLAQKVPDRREEFEQLAAKYRGFAEKPPVKVTVSNNGSRPGGTSAVVEKAKEEAAQARANEPEATPEDRQRVYDEAMKELEGLVGINGVKDKIKRLMKSKAIEAKRLALLGLPPTSTSQHLAFVGSPGTGKTTVARIISRLYYGLGITQRNHLEETGRSDLVAAHIGGTEEKTTAVLEKSYGGVLFIDEVYSLAQGGEKDFGTQAINLLITAMENRAADLVVIVAGYTYEMKNFLANNSGLESRFKEFIEFEDYSDEELIEIFNRRCKKEMYTYDKECLAVLKKIIAYERSISEKGKFGNARIMRNTFDTVKEFQQTRVYDIADPTKEDLTTLKVCDFEEVLAKRIKQTKNRENAPSQEEILRAMSLMEQQANQAVREPVNEQKNMVPPPVRQEMPAPQYEAPQVSPSFCSDAKYVLPPLDLLEDIPEQNELKEKNRQELAGVAELVENKLRDFGVEIKCENIVVGPSVSRLECRLISKTPLSKIENYEDDISMALRRRVRLLLPIRGKDLIGIEVPNTYRMTVGLKQALLKAPQDNKKINFLVGEDIEGNVKYLEFKSLPHMLVAGQTGSGKSVFLQCLINSILLRYTPREVQFVLIDFKRVEFLLYNGLPNVIGGKVIDEHKDALDALQALCKEMDDRYAIIASDPHGVDSIEEYNAVVEPSKRLPLIVCIIDEYADMIGGGYKKDFNACVTRLVQKARAAAIHIIVSTQRPSVDVIDGIIKANLPTKVALSVASHVDSGNIINASGAQNLTGMGDMLMSQLGIMDRYQSAFISKGEVRAITNYLKTHN